MADDTRARLLAEARDQYLAHGLESLSLREVARRVGVSPAAVYRHFDGKEALVAAVCAEGFRIFSMYLLRALSGKDARARLSACTEMYLRFGLENPHDYRVIFMSPPSATHKHEHERDSTHPTFQFLVDRVRECIDAHVLREAEPVELAGIIWAHVHGFVSLRLCGHLQRIGDDEAFAGFYRAAVDRLLAGLGPAR